VEEIEHSEIDQESPSDLKNIPVDLEEDLHFGSV
jgi:hypothetical protein